MDINKELSHAAFLNREYSVSHLAYEREMAFFQNIKAGNYSEVRRLFKPLDSDGLGQISEDPLRNIKYHLIITVALITRNCIEGGMEMEEAFNLSDIYIRSIDKCRNENELKLLHREVVDDFTQRMQILHKNSLHSKAVILCIDYIYDNLHTKITLERLSEIANMSCSHLSRIFHKEMGITISKYIIQKRMEAAENMLKFTDYSCIEIANYLCFSSESHFIQTFKKHLGITPKCFRDSYFRKDHSNIL